MQQGANPTIPHSLLEFIYFALVALVASGSTYLFPKLKRRQTEADIHKTDAETRQIDLSSMSSGGDFMLGLMKQAAIAMADVERLRVQKDFWQAKVEAEEAERSNRWDEARTRLLAQNDVLQSQLSDKDRQEQAARARTHRAIAEIERCVFAIRAYEETLKENKVHCMAFEVKSYEEIMGVDLR